MSVTLATLQARLQDMIGDDGGVYASKYTNVINDAAREIYPILFRRLIDETLITGNILPPFIWTSSSALALYSTSSVTLTKTTTAGLFRNGNTSAKALAGGVDAYITLTSDAYPRLLDVMDNDVDFKCWAYPYDTADDSFLTIYTVQADGTAQTLNSTTASYAGKFNLLELEDQSINDDITDIEFRLRVHTNAKYTYFDPPRVTGKAVYEYMLPQYFQDGTVCQVWIQTSGYSDDACDDLHPRYGEEIFGWKIINDGSYKYLRLPYLSSERKLRLIGYCPLENDLSDTDNTMTIDGERTNLLLSYAAYLLYERLRGTPASEDRSLYAEDLARFRMKYEDLKRRHRMSPPSSSIGWSL